MIDTSSITKLVTHDSCADGLATAMIVKDALPRVEVVFAQHGTPSLEALTPIPGTLFCDITPPRARAAEFVEAGAYVLDHHKHARDIVELFGERGIFADEQAQPGVSGAMLAYEHIWRCSRRCSRRRHGLQDAGLVQKFAQLVGVRDTWQTSSPSWALANHLHASLMGMPREYWLDGGGIERALSADSMYLGQLRLKQRAATIARICDSGTLAFTDAAGRRWAAFPDSGYFVSDVADELLRRGVPVTVGWFQTIAAEGQLETALSLRCQDGSLDVGALCTGLGGGGHTRAAGCRVAASDPLDAVARLLAQVGP